MTGKSLNPFPQKTKKMYRHTFLKQKIQIKSIMVTTFEKEGHFQDFIQNSKNGHKKYVQN